MPSKPEEVQQQRPTPAVEQVWRTIAGNEYAICKHYSKSGKFATVFSDGEYIGGWSCPGSAVRHSDTYVGKFAGFKVEGE